MKPTHGNEIIPTGLSVQCRIIKGVQCQSRERKELQPHRKEKKALATACSLNSTSWVNWGRKCSYGLLLVTEWWTCGWLFIIPPIKLESESVFWPHLLQVRAATRGKGRGRHSVPMGTLLCSPALWLEQVWVHLLTETERKLYSR